MRAGTAFSQGASSCACGLTTANTLAGRQAGRVTEVVCSLIGTAERLSRATHENRPSTLELRPLRVVEEPAETVEPTLPD
jgi:hypothetical protein